MVDAETAYGSEKPMEMVVQYLWVTLQAHRMMDDFLRTQFRQHFEVAPHIGVSYLKQREKAQSKTINQMENICK